MRLYKQNSFCVGEITDTEYIASGSNEEEKHRPVHGCRQRGTGGAVPPKGANRRAKEAKVPPPL